MIVSGPKTWTSWLNNWTNSPDTREVPSSEALPYDAARGAPSGAPGTFVPREDTSVEKPKNRENSVAVRLRLMRMGKKKQPTYRVVAADARSPRDGRFIEIVGTYNPRIEPSEIKIDNAKAVGWLREGAQPSERVKKLFEVSGAWSAFEAGTTKEELEAAAVKAAEAEKAEAEKAEAEKAGAEA